MASEADLKARTKSLALAVIKLAQRAPKDVASMALARQIVRSGTSIAANYRSACRAKSGADFISKLSIVEEEADETILWLELIEESGIVPLEITKPIRKEAGEITAIVVASIKTARNNRE